MAMNDSTAIEWTSELEYDDDDGAYDRSASGRLVIEGPAGKLVVLRRFRAMIEESKGLQEPGVITESTTYYRPGDPSGRPSGGSHTDWDVPRSTLEDEDAFLEECRAALLADPEVEYNEELGA